MFVALARFSSTRPQNLIAHRSAKLTDTAMLHTLRDSCRARMREDCEFVWYEWVEQTNGYVTIVATSGVNSSSRIVRFAIPAEKTGDSTYAIQKEPLSMGKTISNCTEGAFPIYKGEYDWSFTECTRTLPWRIKPQRYKSLVAIRLTEEIKAMLAEAELKAADDTQDTVKQN